MVFTITDIYGKPITETNNIRYNDLLAAINKTNVILNNARSSYNDILNVATELSDLFRGYVMYSYSHVEGKINVDDTLIKGTVVLDGVFGKLKVSNFDIDELREKIITHCDLSATDSNLAVSGIAHLNAKILAMMITIISECEPAMHESKARVDAEIKEYNAIAEKEKYGFKIVDMSVGIDGVTRNAGTSNQW